MENQITDLKVIEMQGNPISQFANQTNFEHGQRVAKMLSSSTLIPKDFQGNIQNTMIALEVANRIGASPLMVMQNLYIVHGKPSWSSSFIIAAINACKRFSPLRFKMEGLGDARSCTAWAYDLKDNEKLEGVPVTMQMAKDEGWISKAGSKWKTMPELMLRYRAAAFFGRMYAPDILMGMHTQEEVQDIQPITESEERVNKEEERAKALIDECKTVKEIEELEKSLPEEFLSLTEMKKQQIIDYQI